MYWMHYNSKYFTSIHLKGFLSLTLLLLCFDKRLALVPCNTLTSLWWCSHGHSLYRAEGAAAFVILFFFTGVWFLQRKGLKFGADVNLVRAAIHTCQITSSTQAFWGAITFSVAPGSLKKEHNCCLKCLQTRQRMWSIFHWQLKPNDPDPVIYLLPAAVCDQQTLRMLDTYEGKGSITFSRAQLCAATVEPETTSVFLGQFCLLLTLRLVRTNPIHQKISNTYRVSLLSWRVWALQERKSRHKVLWWERTFDQTSPEIDVLGTNVSWKGLNLSLLPHLISLCYKGLSLRDP